MITAQKNSKQFLSSRADLWFEDLIQSIQLDRELLETGLASKETRDTYSLLMKGSTDEIFKMSKESSNQYFISNIIIDYLMQLAQDNCMPRKLAFDYSNSRVLVWAEVGNESEEDALILAQAEINAKYQDYGICLTSSIVETEDKLTIPPHYKELTNKA